VTDLIFDPAAFTIDGLVVCSLARSPRSADRDFEPRPRDIVRIDDGDGDPVWGVVVRRNADEVLVEVIEPEVPPAVRDAIWLYRVLGSWNAVGPTGRAVVPARRPR
jgi:hypothetical protein